MDSEIISLGIDVGTSTTKIIFASLTLRSLSVLNALSDVQVVNSQILYRSPIYFTPLLSEDEIDLPELKKILNSEFQRSQIQKDQIKTGAIIITGETARKINAQTVLTELSDFAGDFVVSVAGPDLESVYAARGAGILDYTKNSSKIIMNINIGGGTTNCAIFQESKLLDSFALDLGGRLIKFDPFGNIIYISNRIIPLVESLHLPIKRGIIPQISDLKRLTDKMASIIFDLLYKNPINPETHSFFINHNSKGIRPDYIQFSGGVAEFIYPITSRDESNPFIYGDIGIILAQSIRSQFRSILSQILEPQEKIRATVIGAGRNSLSLSGNTILITEKYLPLKNIPVLKIMVENSNDIDQIIPQIRTQMGFYPSGPIAVSFRGPSCPTYQQVQQIAQQLFLVFDNFPFFPVIIVLESDFAKALGQAIRRIISIPEKIMCIDRIQLELGDYLDIGFPIFGAVPVVVKTLVFSKK